MSRIVKIILLIILIIILLILWLLFGGGETTPEGATVFVSSATYDGNFGSGQVTAGYLAADARCQELADAAGLTGTYKAWISGRVDTGAGPLNQGVVDRFTQSAIAYRLVNGAQVADDWTDLTDGTLDHAINLTEAGNPVDDSARVWTNTTSSGAAFGNGTSCAQGPGPDAPTQIASWSCGAPSWSPGDCQFQSGKYGLASSATASWTGTGSSSNSCSSSYHLYCVQQ